MLGHWGSRIAFFAVLHAGIVPSAKPGGGQTGRLLPTNKNPDPTPKAFPSNHECFTRSRPVNDSKCNHGALLAPDRLPGVGVGLTLALGVKLEAQLLFMKQVLLGRRIFRDPFLKEHLQRST